MPLASFMRMNDAGVFLRKSLSCETTTRAMDRLSRISSILPLDPIVEGGGGIVEEQGFGTHGEHDDDEVHYLAVRRLGYNESGKFAAGLLILRFDKAVHAI